MLDPDAIALSDYRLDKAKNLQVHAESLFAGNAYDSCINRSYYAIFNTVRSLLALMRLDSATHSGVISMLICTLSGMVL